VLRVIGDADLDRAVGERAQPFRRRRPVGELLRGIPVTQLIERIKATPRQSGVDAIRIPMMLIAFVAAIVNLIALWQVRRLRHRSSSAWRQQPLTPAKKRSETLQLVLSVLTIALLVAEWAAHFKLKGTL